MSELTDLKLKYLKQTKQAIREALIAKGQEVSSTDTFRSYAGKITAMAVKIGESGLKITTGEFTPQTGGNTIEHNLGVIPDVIVIFPGEPTPAFDGSNGVIQGTYGFSAAVGSKTGMGSLCYVNSGGTLGSSQLYIDDSAHQDTLKAMGIPREPTATHFKVGGGTYGYAAGKRHRWIAFGNLFDA